MTPKPLPDGVQWGPMGSPEIRPWRCSHGGMGNHHPLLGGWEIMEFLVFWVFFGGFWSKNQKTMVTNHGSWLVTMVTNHG